VIAALMLAAPPAMAEPVFPVPPPPPPPVQDAPVEAAAAPALPVEAAAAPALPVEAAAAPALPAEAAAAPAPPPDVPHLASPENLPPGTVDDPVAPSQPRLTYLRELWHAMQTQEVSGSDALLLLTQRPLVANAAPPPGVPAGPQAPLPPALPLPAAPPALPLPPAPPAP
jgi:resuscitation-promoting factor RpfA